MDICDAYRADKNFLGEIGICLGTKEREACSCQGDKTKCDFYPKTNIRPITTSVAHYTLNLENGTIRAKPIITNADRIRAMTDEEIEKWFWWMHKEMMYYTDSRHFLHEWLKEEAGDKNA